MRLKSRLRSLVEGVVDSRQIYSFVFRYLSSERVSYCLRVPLKNVFKVVSLFVVLVTSDVDGRVLIDMLVLVAHLAVAL